MGQSVLDSFKRSGDANLGQTLLRLAALAETAHQFQVAQQVRGRGSLKTTERGVEGHNPQAGSDHTEVVR